MRESSDDHLAALVRRALEEGPFTIQQLATEAGVSYDTLYSWAKHRRVPRRENVEQLAKGFESRAERLWKIARDLRMASEDGRGE